MPAPPGARQQRKEPPHARRGKRQRHRAEQTHPLQEDGRLTWTVTETAQLLGISRASAYEAAHRGDLPVRLIGRRMLVPRVALLRLLAEQS